MNSKKYNIGKPPNTLIVKLKLGLKSVTMVQTQFWDVLCTKQSCLAPGCKSWCSAKIKFHAFVYGAARKCSWSETQCLPSHMLSYNSLKLLVFVSLFNSILPEIHLFLFSCPSLLLLLIQWHCIPCPPLKKIAISSTNTFWCPNKFLLHNEVIQDLSVI